MIKRFIIAFILLVVVVGGLVGFNLFRDKAIQDFFATMQRPPVAVSTAEVKAVSWEPTIRAIGTVNAANGVDLTAEVTGVVKEIQFTANQSVKQGDVLVRLDDEVLSDPAMVLNVAEGEQRRLSLGRKKHAILLR